ncbi:MAG: DedA family protein [Spirochaetes bacterium]|nr:DedA family protein [Spirochaetota bacterium]
MNGFLDEILKILLPMNDAVLYFFLFISALIENLFPPIPGDTITVLGAFLVGAGRLEFLYVYIFTTLGSVFGFMALVGLGKYLGRKYFHDKDYSHFPKERIVKTEAWIHSHGYLVVLANRFFPGIRSVISVAAGMSDLRNSLIFLFAFASAAVWNLIWIYAGFSLGSNWDQVQEKITEIFKKYNIIMIVLVAIIAAAVFIKKIRSDKKGNK